MLHKGAYPGGTVHGLDHKPSKVDEEKAAATKNVKGKAPTRVTVTRRNRTSSRPKAPQTKTQSQETNQTDDVQHTLLGTENL